MFFERSFAVAQAENIVALFAGNLLVGNPFVGKLPVGNLFAEQFVAVVLVFVFDKRFAVHFVDRPIAVVVLFVVVGYICYPSVEYIRFADSSHFEFEPQRKRHYTY